MVFSNLPVEMQLKSSYILFKYTAHKIFILFIQKNPMIIYPSEWIHDTQHGLERPADSNWRKWKITGSVTWMFFSDVPLITLRENTAEFTTTGTSLFSLQQYTQNNATNLPRNKTHSCSVYYFFYNLIYLYWQLQYVTLLNKEYDDDDDDCNS